MEGQRVEFSLGERGAWAKAGHPLPASLVLRGARGAPSLYVCPSAWVRGIGMVINGATVMHSLAWS